MRRLLAALVAVAALAFMPGAAFAQSPADAPAASAPAAPVPAPSPAPSTSVAAIAPKRETVTEYVLYEGDFDDEAKKPLFSDGDLDVVKFHKMDEVRTAARTGRARPNLCISRRVCSYPLAKNKAGELVRQAHGSTCDESEVI